LLCVCQFTAIAEVIGLPACPLRMLSLSENHGGTVEALAALGRALASNHTLVSHEDQSCVGFVSLNQVLEVETYRFRFVCLCYVSCRWT
jgi:hypothetical protein